MSDKEIVENIIQKISLPLFSRYFKNRLLFRGVNLIKVDNNGLYKLPIDDDANLHILKSLEHNGMIIKGLAKINRHEKSMGAYFNSPMYVPNFNGARYNSSFNIDSFANSFTYGTMAEALDPGLNPIFIEPYYFKMTDPVVNYTLFAFDVEVFTTHAKNLSTIQDGVATMFEELVKLDMMKVLWNTDLKYIDNIETPYSVVQLKIDEWANAEDKRQDLITSFRDANLVLHPMIIS